MFCFGRGRRRRLWIHEDLNISALIEMCPDNQTNSINPFWDGIETFSWLQSFHTEHFFLFFLFFLFSFAWNSLYILCSCGLIKQEPFFLPPAFPLLYTFFFLSRAPWHVHPKASLKLIINKGLSYLSITLIFHFQPIWQIFNYT